MTLKRWDAVNWIDLTLFKRWDGVNWLDISFCKRWDGVNWIDIPLPGGGGGGLSITINDGSPFGSVFSPHSSAPLFRTVTTNSVTVTPTGGTGPYTYAWTRVSGDSAVNVSNATNPTVSFNANVPRDGERSATWRCTVTDSLLATAYVDCVPSLFYFTDL